MKRLIYCSVGSTDDFIDEIEARIDMLESDDDFEYNEDEE